MAPQQATARPEAAGVQPRLGSFVVVAGALSLLTFHWLLATSALNDKCNTCDEIIHVASGCSYWLKNDYRLQPENGNLPQRWHALPIVLTEICRLPGPEHPGWKRSDAWQIGEAMFFGPESDPDLLLARGRAMAALLGVGICLTVFLWSRRLFGARGGLLSLMLSVFCPALLAHGPLMTSDACLTLFLLLSVWAIWELLHEITPLRLASGAIAIGGLFLSKMSAPIILPMAGLMVAVRLWSQQPLIIRLASQRWKVTLRSQQLAAAVAVTVICGLFAYAAVWAAYGFRYSSFVEGPLADARLHKLNDIPTACSVIPGRSGRIIAWMADKHILPEAYLYGTAYVLAHLKRVAFLNGEYSITGWRQYFPYCFAVKTPLALFGMLILGGFALRRGATDQSPDANIATAAPHYHLAPLIVLLIVYWASAIQSTFNIGYRHILPVYPALYIVCGAAASWWSGPPRSMRLAAVGMLVLFVADSLAAFPHYLAYFNPLVPRDEAYRHLVDSNLDWGQDLPGLAKWLNQNSRSGDDLPVYLAYFGNARPAHYGIDAIALPPADGSPQGRSFQPGLYCISATELQAVYEAAGGRWNKAYEERYQRSRRRAACNNIDYIAYLRLLAWLRHRAPDANIGYSILIFRLTADNLDAALNGPPAELDERPWIASSLKHLPP